MANDNHLSSVTLYNVTMNNNRYYNEFFELGQQKINFNFYELCLPDDDPVYTLKKVMEDLDFTNLSAYKPLAKVEELEENNYNMIDNVLNNDSSQKEEKRVQGRISVKEKLAEKKAIIEQRDKDSKTMPEKDTEKKNQREI